jgi:hypothetical protein
MMTTNKLITSSDPKGQDATAKWCAVYNKQRLVDGPDGSAQRLNESREFWKELGDLIQKHSATNQFADQVVSSSYTYPPEYKGPKVITEQVKTIATMFGLDPTQALGFAEKLPALPKSAEGWFAIPKVSAVAEKHFAGVVGVASQYCEAVLLTHTMIKSSRTFFNYREGEIIPAKLRLHLRTANALAQLAEDQPGDIMIIAAQLGMLHKGKSVNRANETFIANEFGLDPFSGCCIALTHPERLVRTEELDMDLPGGEFSPGAVGSFSRAACLYFGDDEVLFGAGDLSYADWCYGSASGFVPIEPVSLES